MPALRPAPIRDPAKAMWVPATARCRFAGLTDCPGRAAACARGCGRMCDQQGKGSRRLSGRLVVASPDGLVPSPGCSESFPDGPCRDCAPGISP